MAEYEGNKEESSLQSGVDDQAPAQEQSADTVVVVEPDKSTITRSIRIPTEYATHIDELTEYAFEIKAIPEKTFKAFSMLAFNLARASLQKDWEKRRGFS